MKTYSRKLTEKRIAKENSKDFISQLKDTLVKVLKDNGLNAAIYSAGCGKESNGTEIGCIVCDEFDKNIRIIHPKDSEKYKIVPNMDGIDFDLAGKGLKQFTKDAKDLANELKKLVSQNESSDDEPMELKEGRTFDDIWANGSYDFQDTVVKMFRKIGWEKVSSRVGEKDRNRFIMKKSIGPDTILTTEVSIYGINSKLNYNHPLFDVYYVENASTYNRKSTNVEDYHTSDLIPEDVKQDLASLEDFLTTHAVGNTSNIGGKPYTHYRYDRFAKPAPKPASTAKERYAANTEGRELLIKAGVPAEFFKDWWVEYDEENTSVNSDTDGDECTYSWSRCYGFTFISKSNKNVWYSIGDELSMKGYTTVHFYPGKMYMPNGDPGYPDEWDESDPTFEDAESNPDVGDWGPDANDDDEIVATLLEYVGMYSNYIISDAENNPEEYFYE